MLYLQHNAQSTQPLYEACYIINTLKSIGYTNEPIRYESLKEEELNLTALAVTESSFAEGWDLSDQEENEYWDNFA